MSPLKGENMTEIMIVDDEHNVRYVVRKMLETEGYKVSEASNGNECLEKLKEEKPDLILLDIMMPDLDGWKVLEKIRSNDDLKSIPIAMLTVKSLTTDTVRRDDIEGLVDYIVKPFTKKSLSGKVKEILETVSKIDDMKKRLMVIGIDIAREYERIGRAEKLHRNLVATLQDVLKQEKEDGFRDVQGIENVIKNELRLVEIYEMRKREIEHLIKK